MLYADVYHWSFELHAKNYEFVLVKCLLRDSNPCTYKQLLQIAKPLNRLTKESCRCNTRCFKYSLLGKLTQFYKKLNPGAPLCMLSCC